MPNYHRQNRNNRCQCHRCHQREFNSQLANQAHNFPSSSESSSIPPQRNGNLWTSGFLGTGAGTDIWRARIHEDCSSNEIIDDTTFTRRCWRPAKPTRCQPKSESSSSSSSSSSQRQPNQPRHRCRRRFL